jgi:hypothetical protein
MLASIQATADAAGVTDILAIPSRRLIGWPTAESLISEFVNPEDRAGIYLVYRSGSVVSHSNWDDLYRFHLKNVAGGFLPNFDDGHGHPEPVYITGLMLTILTQQFVDKLHPRATEHFSVKLQSLDNRLRKLAALHSKFLDS